MNPALLIFSALFALAGYQEARRFARQHGATPWGWDPWVWAIVMFLSWVIGLVLLAIAERQGRRHPRRSIPPDTPTAVAMPAAQWATDPSGRYQQRWWDGSAWTSHVATDGVSGLDPVE
jgi:hypothetical protein